MATLIAPAQNSAYEDAEAIQKACEGWGADESAIIAILGHRNAAQRLQIRQAYKDLYQEDLVKRLESELRGKFERAVYRWILEPVDREAVLVNVAIKKSSDYQVIIEIACVGSPEELLAVRKAYQARYKHSLEEDLAAHTSGDIRRLVVALATAYRYEGDEINQRWANSEAEILHDLIKEKAYHDDEIVRILSTRSKSQLIATFNRYRETYGISITKDLSEDSSNKLADLLHAAIHCLNDSGKYFEKVLRKAIRNIGNEEDALTRVIVTRAEKDLKNIKERYNKKNSVTLDQAVANETSGDYKAFLLALMGKQD